MALWEDLVYTKTMDSYELFNSSITAVKGIGDKRAEELAKMGIRTLYDLVFNYPVRYEDRRDIRSIDKLTCDGTTLQGFVGRISSRVTVQRNRNRSWCTVSVSDGTDTARLTFFNALYLQRLMKPGDIYVFYGYPERRGMITLVNPSFEKYRADKQYRVILPIYRGEQKVGAAGYRKAVAAACEMIKPLPEYLPASIMSKYNFLPLYDSLMGLHFPEDFDRLERSKQRLLYEEILIIKCVLDQYSRRMRASRDLIKDPRRADVSQYIEALPYKLTTAQEDAWIEICRDMESRIPMNRLVQGDVGCGKSILAYLALTKASLSGYQALMMAPTEVLAEQLYRDYSRMFPHIPSVLITGGMRAQERREVRAMAQSCQGLVAFGTHALLVEDISYANIGLVVTDEQHRFGVEQRKVLINKANRPDVLIMSATPIPRTLALTMYGDMDISVVNQLPAGRQPVKTYVVNPAYDNRILDFIAKTTSQGDRAYVVCPLVEEAEDAGEMAELGNQAELVSAEEMFGVVTDFAADKPWIKPVLVHGRLKKADKDSAMEAFRTGEANVMVSTTVIEVGVNVPEANLMIIQNGERFGLSQLHQLRGRVGRGNREATCIVVDRSGKETSYERLRIFKSSNDGFYIAEKDLEQRGPGNFFGTGQHGMPPMKMSAFFKNVGLLSKVSEDIEEMNRTMTEEERQMFSRRMETEIQQMQNNNYYIG